jgi:hypothetical protein
MKFSHALKSVLFALRPQAATSSRLVNRKRPPGEGAQPTQTLTGRYRRQLPSLRGTSAGTPILAFEPLAALNIPSGIKRNRDKITRVRIPMRLHPSGYLQARPLQFILRVPGACGISRRGGAANPVNARPPAALAQPSRMPGKHLQDEARKLVVAPYSLCAKGPPAE